MSKDYAKRSNTRKKLKKKKVSSNKWKILLLLLVIATAGVFFFSKTQLINIQLNKLFPTKSIKIKQTSKPVAVTKKTITPKIDFYNILPQNKNNDLKTKNDSEEIEYELGITALNNFAEADRLKAELTLLGFAAKISTIYHQNTKQYYVSVGPYENQDVAKLNQERLKSNKIQSTLKKLK